VEERVILPQANVKAKDLVSALNVPMQAVRTRLPEQPITATQLPVPEAAVTPENILETAKGGKFASFVSNPNFIRFLAEMGSAIGGEGSVGERLGQATIDLQRSQIYDQALSKALAGESLEGIPVNLLSPEQQITIDQQRLNKLKIEAEIDKIEHDIETKDITRGEEVEALIKSRLDVAKIGAISRIATQGKTPIEIASLIKEESEAAFGRSKSAILKGKGEVRPEFEEIDQANFIQNMGLFDVGGAKEQVSRFFPSYTTELEIGEMFYTDAGIYIRTETGADLVQAF
ncbi:hypothetical protein LCGC14_2961260, partial [marine sediment metagenome]